MLHDRLRGLIGTQAIFAAAMVALVVVVYAPAWRLPLFQDDIDHFAWIGGQDVATLWSMSPFGYYRPLTQTVWKISQLLAGRFSPALLHGVNLVLHTVNALLAGYLVGAWLPGRLRRRGTWLAGALFALYPFAFQVVLFVGALYHPLAASLILGTLAGHRAYRLTGHRVGLAVSLACALLAPLAHESGLIAGALLGLSEIAWARAQRRRPAWPLLAWAAAAPVVGFVVWSSVPRSGPQTARPDLAGALINLTYALQALAYPIGPILRSVVDATGLPDQTVIWIGGGSFLIAAGIIARRAGCWSAFLMGGALWLGGALPYAITLVPSYTLAAPRLLYVSSIGVVCLWAAGLIGLGHAAGRWQPARAALAVIGVTAILAFGVWFIRTRVSYYELLGDALWNLGEALRGHAQDRSALVVNFPRLARPAGRVFPMGVESPLFFGRASNLRDALAVNGIAAPDEVQTMSFGNLLPPLDYSIATMGRDADWPDLAAAIASTDRVYRSDPAPEAVVVRFAGRRVTPVSPASLVRFDRAVVLTDAASSWTADRTLAVRLRWQYAGGADDALVFVHVLNQRGELVAQSDGPVMDMLPFWQWPAGSQIEEVRYILLKDAEARRVQVGLYDANSGRRLTPVDAHGAIYPDGSAPLFELEPETGAIRPLITR